MILNSRHKSFSKTGMSLRAFHKSYHKTRSVYTTQHRLLTQKQVKQILYTHSPFVFKLHFFYSGTLLWNNLLGGRGGGEGYSTKVYMGRPCPKVQTLYPFNFCKCTVFRIMNKYKTRTFLRLFHSHKMHLLFGGLFYRLK